MSEETRIILVNSVSLSEYITITNDFRKLEEEIERLNKNIQATRNCILKDIAILKTRNDISQEEMVTRLKATLIILG